MGQCHRLTRPRTSDDQQGTGTNSLAGATVTVFGRQSLGRIQEPQVIEFLQSLLHDCLPKSLYFYTVLDVFTRVVAGNPQ
jgi:hypothetical protein